MVQLVSKEFCIHEYAPAINLANGYGYMVCKHCGKLGPNTNLSKAFATYDEKRYAQHPMYSAHLKIRKQPFFT